MPSNPMRISMISVTPCLSQFWTSEALMRREALAMSGVDSPTPAQNSLRPPPEPVLSTMGVLKVGGPSELFGHRCRKREDGG